MLGRKQEINLKLNQIADGLVLLVAFWISHKLRYDNFGGILTESVKIPPLKEFIWLMFIVVPFTPLQTESRSHTSPRHVGHSNYDFT